MMKFTFYDKDDLYELKYTVYFLSSGGISISTTYLECECDISRGVVFNIIDNEIMWKEEHNSFIKLTTKAKDHINRMMKLKSFW
jgi:hypothetical protein